MLQEFVGKSLPMIYKDTEPAQKFSVVAHSCNFLNNPETLKKYLKSRLHISNRTL